MAPTPIYTRTGDKGMSGLGSLRLPKHSPIFDVIGSLDTLQVKLGVVIKTLSIATNPEARDHLAEAEQLLSRVQTIVYEFSGLLHRAANLSHLDDSGSESDDDPASTEDASDMESAEDQNEIEYVDDYNEPQVGFFRRLVSIVFGPTSTADDAADNDNVTGMSLSLSPADADDFDEHEQVNQDFANRCAILSDMISGSIIDMEQSIDGMTAELPVLRHFIRVDKNMSYETIFIHDCRCFVREVERDVSWLMAYLQDWDSLDQDGLVRVFRAFDNQPGQQLITEFAKCINRLSDHLFTVARYHAHYCKFFNAAVCSSNPSPAPPAPMLTQDHIFESSLGL